MHGEGESLLVLNSGPLHFDLLLKRKVLTLVLVP
jgi:hypothetical protein